MRGEPGHLSALYKNRLVYVWVEDEETRTYLQTVWQDPEFGFFVAGGSENIAAAVHAARNDNLPHVFGFRDRDFGVSNRANWGDPSVRLFTSEAFEVENLLLDARAMAGCDLNTTGKNADDLENEMKGIASQLDWWMACRRAIVGLRDAVTTEFIGHPSRTGVRSLADATNAITSSAWWTKTLPGISTAATLAQVQADLARRRTEYVAMIASGQWRMGFSGKEIFREMRSRVWTKKPSPDPEGRLDFVKAVAAKQRDYQTVPAEITELRRELRARVGK
jgi:hypothetical protein